MMPMLAPVLLALALLGGPTAGVATSIHDPAEGWPLQPPVAVVRDFAPPDQPWLAGHRGVDLAGSPGAAVRAPIAGRVTVARRIVDRDVVVISTGSRRVTLEPVRATVATGEIVAAGDRIGVLQAGHRGCPRAACLHWGLLVGQQYRDPLLLVLDYRPVLLPVPAGRE
jgi:murein DD-endopeptidase MepM/ murein hydrolase activator NlpD